MNFFVHLVHKMPRGRVESISYKCSLLVVLSPHLHLASLELPLVLSDRCFLPFQGGPLLQVVPIQKITLQKSSTHPTICLNSTTLVGSILTLSPVGPITPLAPWSPVAPWKHNNQGHIKDIRTSLAPAETGCGCFILQRIQADH